METLTIDLKKKKSFEIGQQGDHNALCIHFINMKNVGTNKKYIYYTIDGIENCVPLTNDRFIIGYPLTAHSGIASAQLISKLNDNSIIKLSNVFAMHIKESKGYKDSGEYPVDPNIQSSYDLLDDLIDQTQDLINNYNYATLMEKLTQASSEATISATTAKECADELKNSTDFINTLDEKVAAQDSKIEKIEASTSHITTKQNTKIAALHTRMSEFTSLKEGSTTGDAELIDARIGADGTKYPSAGDAMRGQVEKLNEDIVEKTNSLKEDLGNKQNLNTDAKTNLVNAINEVNDRFLAPVADAVKDWLDKHPEATTTVQDKSLTDSKFTDKLKLQTLKDYVTPEMFGAIGDGVTDDTEAIVSALNSGIVVFLKDKIYRITNDIQIKSGNVLLGGKILLDGATLICSQENKNDRNGFLLDDITIIVDDDSVKSAIKVSRCFSGTITGVTIKAKTEYLNSKWNGIDVISNSSDNGVLFLNIDTCRIMGAKIGLNVSVINDGYITSCVFDKIIIESFTEIAISVQGANAFSNNFTNFNVDDNFSSNHDRYGIYTLNNAGNTFENFNIWADTLDGDNLHQFYAIKIDNITDYSKNMIFSGYVEGIIDNTTKYLMQYCKCNFYYAEFNTLEKTRRAIGKVTNDNYGINKYSERMFLLSRKNYGSVDNIYVSTFTDDVRLNVHGSGMHGVEYSLSGNNKKCRIIVDCECNNDVTLLITANGETIYSNTLKCKERSVFASTILTLENISVFIYTNSNEPIRIYGLNLNFCGESDFATIIDNKLLSYSTPNGADSIITNPNTGECYKLVTDGHNVSVVKI